MNREEELLQLIKELKKEKRRIQKKIRDRKYYFKNKEGSVKEYRLKNKERDKETRRKRDKTEEGRKVKTKSDWKYNGLKMENFEEIYKRYINTTHCDCCNVLLTIDNHNTQTQKCMDHSHVSGEFRNVLCRLCNVRRGENNLIFN